MCEIASKRDPTQKMSILLVIWRKFSIRRGHVSGELWTQPFLTISMRWVASAVGSMFGAFSHLDSREHDGRLNRVGGQSALHQTNLK